MAGYYEWLASMKSLRDSMCLTVVVLTPKCSAGEIGVRAAGVSMNSNSSEASDTDVDMIKMQMTWDEFYSVDFLLTRLGRIIKPP